MPNTSANKKRKMTTAEYADWLHTPEGRTAERKALRGRASRPVLTIDTPLTAGEAADVAKATGAGLRMTEGLTQKPNDPSVVQGIIDRAAQKTTQAISIRIPVEDLEAAKRLADKTGLGYQKILKDLIHEGLQRAS